MSLLHKRLNGERIVDIDKFSFSRKSNNLWLKSQESGSFFLNTKSFKNVSVKWVTIVPQNTLKLAQHKECNVAVRDQQTHKFG